MQVKQLWLYFLILVLGLLVVVVAMGGGLFGQSQPWYQQWQHYSFWHLCHQIPERSFRLGGQPMAVCSRCFGIYAGFLGGWLLLPLWPNLKITRKLSAKKIALCALLLNLFDIVGNILGFWQNTLVSRMALGVLVGASAALIFTGDFFTNIIKSMENYYGRVTTADS